MLALQLPVLSPKKLSLTPKYSEPDIGAVKLVPVPTAKGRPSVMVPIKDQQGKSGAKKFSRGLQTAKGTPAGVLPGSAPVVLITPVAVIVTRSPAFRCRFAFVQGWLAHTVT